MQTKTLSLFVLILLSAGNIFGQSATISGYVKDASSGEALLGTTIYVKETLQGTSANQYGFYSLTIPKGNYTIVYKLIGFNEISKQINLENDVRENVELKSSTIDIQEISISAEKADKNVQSIDMGKNTLEVEKIKTLPAFFGEVDILKTIQLLPGVQSAGEGNSGYYVRGGGPDQNLILLDEATVYNASHLFGFFSVFNADAIQNLTLTKGGMPANYGGRLASVLDIQMKEGNNKEFHGEGGLGFIASRFTFQGPIKKDTSSFIVSARRTFVDLFLREPFIKKGSNAEGNSYYFYDLNAKVNYKFNDKNRVFLSGYFGRDVFKFNSPNSDFAVNIPWGNATLTARWNHLFNDKLFLNTSIIYTDYQFEFTGGQDAFEFKLFSGITDYNAKLDFTYLPNVKHNIKFGGQYIYHTFVPSSVSARSGDVVFDLGGIVKNYAHDFALFANDEWDITPKFKVSYGGRFTIFQQVGPYKRYVLDASRDIVTDTINYERGENVKTYSNFEPRLAMRYTLNDVSSLKASYTQNYQYIHLATQSGVSLPTDVWVPSSQVVKPQYGTQYALGYFRNFKDNWYETSIEVYYKELKNQIEYKDGSLPENNVGNNIDNQFEFGSGEAYGIELFLKKAKGKFNGWIGYTFAFTNRTFPNLNGGKTFSAKYDRRHDASIVLTYELSSKWTFGATWVYATGNALTLPQERYLINDGYLLGNSEVFPGQITYEYGERNSYRQPAYHRLDVSATLTVKKKKKWESSWNFSVFNVYNRANPYFIYFDDVSDYEKGILAVQAKQVSLFPLLPSVTYNFKF